jgi:hypothetical protein
MIMFQFEDFPSNVGGSNLHPVILFFEKKTFDDLWAHYHSVAFPTQLLAGLGQKKEIYNIIYMKIFKKRH